MAVGGIFHPSKTFLPDAYALKINANGKLNGPNDLAAAILIKYLAELKKTMEAFYWEDGLLPPMADVSGYILADLLSLTNIVAIPRGKE